MIIPEYSDMALSFSPEAFYTGIPDATKTRGMMYGRGKAEKLHQDTRLSMTLAEQGREFDLGFGEQQRQYDESMGFGREQFEFLKEQYDESNALQREYMSLLKSRSGGSTGSGNRWSDFFDDATKSKPDKKPRYDYGGGGGPIYESVGGSPGFDEVDSEPSYYDPNTGGSVYDFIYGGQDIEY